MIYYLYVKTHNQTGLKYLGQTQRNDVFYYKGSGTRWLNHLNVHGKNISTEIIGAFDNVEDLKISAQFWSKYWNVVQSDEWANLVEENGFQNGFRHTTETKQKISKANKGNKRPDLSQRNKLGHTQETKKKMSLAKQNYIPWNVGLTEADPRVASYCQKRRITLLKKKELLNTL